MPVCAFCVLVAKKAAASVVYEDESTLVFMDRRQPTEGHVLVVPKQHVETIDQLDAATAAQLMQTVVLTARAIRRTLQPAGISVWQSNGAAAGQEVPHVHVHVLARQPDDGLLRVYQAQPPLPERADLDRMAAHIKARLDWIA